MDFKGKLRKMEVCSLNSIRALFCEPVLRRCSETDVPKLPNALLELPIRSSSILRNRSANSRKSIQIRLSRIKSRYQSNIACNLKSNLTGLRGAFSGLRLAKWPVSSVRDLISRQSEHLLLQCRHNVEPAGPLANECSTGKLPNCAGTFACQLGNS